MKKAALGLALALISSSAFAESLTLECQFLPRTHLSPFTLTLTEKSATLEFQGRPDELEDMNPSGEMALLNRRLHSADWLTYSGSEVMKSGSPCVYEVNNVCMSPARGFELAIPLSALTASVISGSLQMTRLSSYLPAESYSSYSISCTRR